MYPQFPISESKWELYSNNKGRTEVGEGKGGILGGGGDFGRRGRMKWGGEGICDNRKK